MLPDEIDALPEVEQAAPDDLRSMLSAAVEEQETATVSPQQAESPASERTRGLDGKFAAKEATETPPEAVVKPEEAQPEVKPVATEPPANWSAADKAKFAALPPDAKEIVAKRSREMEADYTRKTQDIAAFRKDFEPIKALFDPHRDDLAKAGYTPTTLVQAWYNVERELQAGRGVGIVKSLVDGYKLDRGEVAKALGLVAPSAAPGTVTPPAPDGAAPIQLPPDIAAKFHNYDQFIAQQQHERQQQAAVAQREAENRVINTIDQFKGAKDPAGSLLHPHFEEVEEHMARLAIAHRTAGEAIPPMDILYEQAVWANPSTRAKAMEATRAAEQAQHATAEAERVKEVRAKAERARRAGSSVTGSPGNGQTAATAARNGTDSIRTALLAAAEEHEAA